MVDLRPDQLAIVQTILETEVPGAEVWAFGSRARWTSRESSDLDLLIRDSKRLPMATLNRLQSLFEESFLPFRVDLADWYQIDESFREAIRAELVLIAAPRPGAVKSAKVNPWHARTLSSCATFLAAGAFPEKSSDFRHGSIPWFRAKDMTNLRLFDSEKHITPLGIENGIRLVPAGTVLVLVRGAALERQLTVGVTQVEAAFHRDIEALIPHPVISPMFLAYALLGRRPAIRALLEDSSDLTRGVHLPSFRSFPIAVPPLEEQHRIVAALDLFTERELLDDETSQTLTAMLDATIHEGRQGPRADRVGSESLGALKKSLLDRIQQIAEQTRVITELRDRILPELISGRIRISRETAALAASR